MRLQAGSGPECVSSAACRCLTSGGSHGLALRDMRRLGLILDVLRLTFRFQLLRGRGPRLMTFDPDTKAFQHHPEDTCVLGVRPAARPLVVRRIKPGGGQPRPAHPQHVFGDEIGSLAATGCSHLFLRTPEGGRYGKGLAVESGRSPMCAALFVRSIRRRAGVMRRCLLPRPGQRAAGPPPARAPPRREPAPDVGDRLGACSPRVYGRVLIDGVPVGLANCALALESIARVGATAKL